MTDRVLSTVAEVFSADIASLDLDSGPMSVPGWDSAGHLRLVLLLEERFAVVFDDDEIVELVSVSSIVESLNRRNAASNPGGEPMPSPPPV